MARLKDGKKPKRTRDLEREPAAVPRETHSYELRPPPRHDGVGPEWILGVIALALLALIFRVVGWH
jgi:hypothetical protein